MNSISYTLPDIIKKHRQEFIAFKQTAYVHREKESILRKNLASPLIKIVIGPRRAGKSRLIQKVLEDKQVAYLNFEEEAFKNQSGDQIIDVARTIYGDVEYWYLDEVQDFPDWETFVNKLHRRGYNLVLTGSNAKLLSSELASSLTGRHISLELLPFSYQEFLQATQTQKSWSTFEAYLQSGGFPEVVLAKDDNKNEYLRTLFDSIVLKDLVQRKKLRNPLQLRDTISLIVNNVASRTSARAISKALDSMLSSVTVDKYLHYLQEAYVIETIRGYSDKVKERLKSERKPYLIDTGLIDAVSSNIVPNLSKKFENAIFLELRRRGFVNDLDLFYYRTPSGREVDFLVKNGHKTESLLQVCLDMSATETREREVRALQEAAKNHETAELIVCTANEYGQIDIGGKKVLMVPGFEFCSSDR